MDGIVIIPFPADFPNKGKYPVFTADWRPDGYRDEPQYPGQMPLNYPEDAKPIECFMGGYIG